PRRFVLEGDLVEARERVPHVRLVVDGQPLPPFRVDVRERGLRKPRPFLGVELGHGDSTIPHPPARRHGIGDPAQPARRPSLSTMAIVPCAAFFPLARGPSRADRRGRTPIEPVAHRLRHTDETVREEAIPMASIERSIDVEVPVRTAYNQWTQFEEFPRFMEGVERVEQLDDTHLHWTATVAGKRKEWNARITAQ